MKTTIPPTIGTAGPIRPCPHPAEVTDALEIEAVLGIADRLLARRRQSLSRLSSAGRLRRWGGAI